MNGSKVVVLMTSESGDDDYKSSSSSQPSSPSFSPSSSSLESGDDDKAGENELIKWRTARGGSCGSRAKALARGASRGSSNREKNSTFPPEIRRLSTVSRVPLDSSTGSDPKSADARLMHDVIVGTSKLRMSDRSMHPPSPKGGVKLGQRFAGSSGRNFLKRKRVEVAATTLQFQEYMDKRVVTKLNGGRLVEGSLRGFDPFLNLVVDDGVEVKKNGERVRIGVVVIRGSSIVMLEALERIAG